MRQIEEANKVELVLDIKALVGWWHDSCYVRYQSGNYQLVSSDYCHH